MPSALGQKWNPPKKAQKMASRINAPETIDPAIFEGSISLAQSIDFALQNNPNTSISWAQLQGAIANLGLARRDYFPTIDISGNVTRTRDGFTFPPDILIIQWLTSWGPRLDVSYTLWDFGARFAKSESALQALFAMAWSYNQEIQNIVQNITNDYYDNLYQKATLANDKQDVEDALVVLEAAEKKLKTGVANVTDYVQAKSNYLQFQVNFVDQKDATAASFINLATDMGMPGNVEFSTQYFPSELPGRGYIASLSDLIDLSLENRPDLIRSKADVASKKAALTQARLEPLPKITGDLNLNYNDYNNFYKKHLNLAGEFKVNFPFFSGFYYRNKIREAKANFKQAQAMLKKQQDLILQQVTTYFTNYNNAIERVECSEAFLDAALEEFDVTLSNYKAGTGDIINVMQAQTSLSDARTKYTRSVKDLFVSLTNLAYATGSLIAPQGQESDWSSIYQFGDSTYEN